MLLVSQRAVPRALRAQNFQFEFGDLQAALSDLLK
jgi:NAD dependent epimerase/dehydratase family enzyme